MADKGVAGIAVVEQTAVVVSDLEDKIFLLTPS